MRSLDMSQIKIASHYNSHYNFRYNFFASETGPRMHRPSRLCLLRTHEDVILVRTCLPVIYLFELGSSQSGKTCSDQSLERESNRSDSKMRARHLLSCLTDGEILILLSSQSVELVHGMLSTYFCILLPKSNWSLLLSCSPAGLSLPARGCSVFPNTAAII